MFLPVERHEFLATVVQQQQQQLLRSCCACCDHEWYASICADRLGSSNPMVHRPPSCSHIPMWPQRSGDYSKA